VVWSPLLQLSRMECLQELSVRLDGSGLPYLARSAANLSGLQTLGLCFDSGLLLSNDAFAAGLSFIGGLVGLSCLWLRDSPSMAPPAWLSSLTALTHIEANLRLSPGNVAALAALPALQQLQGVTWTAGGGGALPAARFPSIAVLVRCSVHHSELPSLAAAFPGLRQVTELTIFDDGDDDEEPHPAAVPAAPAAWRSLQTLTTRGLKLQERHMAAVFNWLLRLLRGASELTSLDLGCWTWDVDNDEEFAPTAFSDADVAALLANAPATLTSLKACSVAALTAAAFAGCPPRPALKTMFLRWMAPPRLNTAGLLALGRALPGLERLCLRPIVEDDGLDGEQQRKRAWIEQLDALGGSAAAGRRRRRRRRRRVQPSFAGADDDDSDEDDTELLRAIRRALARDASAAGVR